MIRNSTAITMVKIKVALRAFCRLEFSYSRDCWLIKAIFSLIVRNESPSLIKAIGSWPIKTGAEMIN